MKDQIREARTIQISSPGAVLVVEGGADAMFEMCAHGSVKKVVLYSLTPADARKIIEALTPLAQRVETAEVGETAQVSQ